MAFELENYTPVKLTDVRVLSQKNRAPDTNPGAKLNFWAELSNDILTCFDGGLKSFLFERNASVPKGQTELDGVQVVSDLPNRTRIGSWVGELSWEQDFTGVTLVIDKGVGGKSNLTIRDCTLSDFKILPKEGGSVLLKFACESEDISKAAFGELAKMKSTEIHCTFTGPVISQQGIDDGLGSDDGDDEGDETPAAKPAVKRVGREPRSEKAQATKDKSVEKAKADSKTAAAKSDWAFGDRGDDNRPATGPGSAEAEQQAASATDAFVASATGSGDSPATTH